MFPLRRRHPVANDISVATKFAILLLAGVLAKAGAGGPEPIRDIEYATVEGKALKLDLHLPSAKARTALVVWVHGGAWRAGSKSSMPLGALLDDGYAVASIDYRLSTEARFPAQIHDIKAAI